jgi:hypothetical protein
MNPPKEQEVAIPPKPVLGAVLAVAAACTALAALGARWTPDPAAATLPMAMGAAGAGIATALSAILFTSATPRPASICGSLWLGATLARFVVVPGVCLLVYWSAPTAGLTPVLAVVGTYLACLAAETVMVVRIVHRSL